MDVVAPNIQELAVYETELANLNEHGDNVCGEWHDTDGHVEIAQPFFRGFELEPLVDSLVNENVSIEGAEFAQLLKIKLQPGELISCEPGSLVVMSQDMGRYVSMGSWSQGCKRQCCAGLSLYRLNFTNHTRQPQYLCLAPIGPGRIIPIDFERYNGIVFSSGAFLAAYGKGWNVNLRPASSFKTGCCGGQGIILSELHGTGMAFLVATGAVQRITLQRGEVYLAQAECIVAFTNSIQYDVQHNGYKLCCCGRMGLFIIELTGPGTVFLESVPIERMRRSMQTRRGCTLLRTLCRYL
uniref:Altered inheritance of mitochondria protein 24, mitochondrial n=1 Tax=Mucochytrium quahogii TaxID=96639 RepID=A0A7S2W8Y9_9STRA|mmetsp:Transcript_19039/g.31155  ORF Transcript_19039/g.31155 Transcript_19039/m.31155 type:complete len:297 (+) Transcript_19039:55-945(+)